MNPDRIYSQFRDDALAKQLEDQEYFTFVAMPFHERFSYRSKDILENVVKPAARMANEIAGRNIRRPFADPFRVDEGPHVAKSITEEIVRSILESHFFLADLTFMNPGVLLELGVALGMKPDRHIICIMQGNVAELHFDIKDKDVIIYDNRDTQGTLKTIAEALISAAVYFEEVEDRYVRRLIQTMNPDELMFLGMYADAQNDYKQAGTGPSLSYQAIKHISDSSKDPDLLSRYEHTMPELLKKRLVWNHIERGKKEYGIHATRLGWKIIKYQLPEFNDVPERAIPE